MYAQWNIIQPQKDGNPAICIDTDKPGGRYAKGNKPERERHTVQSHTLNLKKKKVKLIEIQRRTVFTRD